MSHLFLALSIVLLCVVASVSNAQKERVVVDVHLFAPFVMADGNAHVGFDIDLWDAIAADLGLASEYRRVGTLKRLFENLTQQQADVAIAGLTINATREEVIDFSHRYIESGLQILVRHHTELDLLAAIRSILTPTLLKVVLTFAGFCILFAHLVWWAERKSGGEDAKYFPGILEWLWWVQVTITTVGYGDKYPKRWWGRGVAILLMYAGIGFFAYFVAQLSSALTLQKLSAEISGPADLRGRTVATVDSSSSVPILESLGAAIVQTETIEEAYAKLLAGEVEAVVFDSPNLLYYAQGEGRGYVTVVGPLFDRQDYGIAFPEGSPLREQVNRALLRLKKSGKYDAIYRQWFGASSSTIGSLSVPAR